MKLELTSRTSEKSAFKTRILYAFTLFSLPLLYSLWAFRDSPLNFYKNSIPLAGDGLGTGFFLQTIQINSWSNILSGRIVNPFVGWPNEMNLASYPTGNLIEVILIKLFASFTKITDGGQLIHIFSIAKAPIIAATAYVAFRLCNVEPKQAILLSTIFSCSFFNIARAEGHFFLGFTWNLCLGIASLIAAFLASTEVGIARQKLMKKSIIYGLPVGFSTFYMTLFIAAVAITLIFVILLNKFFQIIFFRNSGSQFKLIPRIAPYIASTFAILFGFTIHIILILKSSSQVKSLSAIGDRSPIEPIIYAGNLESLFFNSTKLMLRVIGKSEALDFLGTRISGEGAFSDSFVGVFLYTLLAYFLINISMKLINLNHKEDNLRSVTLFLFLLLLIALLLYIPSFLSVGFSQIVPQLRAWGRISVLIALLILLIIGSILVNIRKNSILLIVLSLTLILNVYDLNTLRMNRADALQVTNQVDEQNTQNDYTLSEISKIIPLNCSIVNLPIFAFPEFDVPYDQEGSLAPLSLISRSQNKFRWSFGSVKDTLAFSPFENFMSTKPNFLRASLIDQISLAKEMNSCAALIDLSMLSQSEHAAFRDLKNLNPNCFRSLPGVIIEGSERYVLVDFKSSFCDLKSSNDVLNSVKFNEESNIFFKVNSAYAKKIEASWQYFDANNTIDLSINSKGKKSINQIKLGIRFDATKKVKLKVVEDLNICIVFEHDNREMCRKLKSSSQLNSSTIQLHTRNFNWTTPLRISVYLQNMSDLPFSWSIRPIL